MPLSACAIHIAAYSATPRHIQNGGDQHEHLQNRPFTPRIASKHLTRLAVLRPSPDARSPLHKTLGRD